MPSAMFNKIMCAILLTLLCNNNIHCIEIEGAPTVAAYACSALKCLTVLATLAVSVYFNQRGFQRGDCDWAPAIPIAAAIHAWVAHKCINPFINAACALTDSKQYSAPRNNQCHADWQKHDSKLQCHIKTIPQAYAQEGLINSLAALSVIGVIWCLKETDCLSLGTEIGFCGWHPLPYYIIPNGLKDASATSHTDGIKKAGNFLK